MGEGQIKGIFICGEASVPMTALDAARALAGQGLEGTATRRGSGSTPTVRTAGN